MVEKLENKAFGLYLSETFIYKITPLRCEPHMILCLSNEL